MFKSSSCKMVVVLSSGKRILIRPVLTKEERFWAGITKKSGEFNEVDGKQSECWVAKGGNRPARKSWELQNGPIPKGRWVMHKCANPRCARLTHLYLSIKRINMAEMIVKGRREINGRRVSN